MPFKMTHPTPTLWVPVRTVKLFILDTKRYGIATLHK